MKLGDILLIETATSSKGSISTAEFRWTDCESAQTIDEIPVFLGEERTIEGFRGTRVSVLGLRDLPEWRRKDRISEITRSLAKLVSPFEATSTFPVGITLDGVDQSLEMITEDVLRRAIADFSFRWDTDAKSQKRVLVAVARFRKRLFTSKRSEKNARRTAQVFEKDGGAGFVKFLGGSKKLNTYAERHIDLNGTWFVELKRTFSLFDMDTGTGAAIADPGPFSGAFYFFHLNDIGEPDEGAAAGIGIDSKLIKGMAGISILRDGFRIRSQGDWLDISSGMTSGSTYNMRVDNTVGYFALTGENNYRLVEKSDREGFVEDATYRGFMQIASRCRKFANDALEDVRRGLDEYYARQVGPEKANVAVTVAGSWKAVEENVLSAKEAKATADQISSELQFEIAALEREANSKGVSHRTTARALQLAQTAVRAMDSVRSKLSARTQPELDLRRLKLEFEQRDDQGVALFEVAAVGLSARGLAHELRIHLTEIRQRTSELEKFSKRSGSDVSILTNLRAIRSSCTAISNAVALIDPMLPRARTIKETIELRDVVERYISTRSATLERADISATVSGDGITVRANRPRVLQVLDNLFRNSVYWIRRGTSAGPSKRPRLITIELTDQGFIFSDTGPGVDPRFEDSLFEMFISAKPEDDPGQGLGLFIIRQLLQLDGCDVELLSDRNEDGNRYRFAVNLRPLALKA